MKFPEKRFMFTVKDITTACGISRATLLRMEESGFLTPYYIDPDSGYRYYDADNITQIGQYQMLQELGLTRKEISDFYYRRMDNLAFLKEQRLKLDRMSLLLSGMEMQQDSSRDYTFHFIDLPETTCYCEIINKRSIPEQESAAYDAYQRMIKNGVRVSMTERIFFMSLAPSDQMLNKETISLINTLMCIPVMPNGTCGDKMRTFPATRAFATVVHGNYTVIPAMTENFCREALDRGLKPTGGIRFVPLVAPCTGEHYAPDDFCYECILPVEREN